MHELIVEFMNTFYGYGNLGGRYWFIGMEEGCGPNWDNDVAPRFHVWQNRGAVELEDLRDYHAAIGIAQHWVPPVVIQRTWRRLIETILTAENGIPPTAAEISTYQAEHLGSVDGQSCLLELLPLPSPSINQFAYTHLANEEYPFFANRRLYKRRVRNSRINHLRNMIAEHPESHIVLYGTTHIRLWNELVQNAPWEQMPHWPQWIKRCNLFDRFVWLVPHPNARGIPGDLFGTLGGLLGE